MMKETLPNGPWPDIDDCRTCSKTGRCTYEHFGDRVASARCEYYPSPYHVLEQRFEQLEQVAREMYAALHINEHCSMEFIRGKGDCEWFKQKLEELGVSVDVQVL